MGSNATAIFGRPCEDKTGAPWTVSGARMGQSGVPTFCAHISG